MLVELVGWCVLSSVLRFTSSAFVAGVQPTIPDPDDDLHVYALPIGQGDATVIQCPKGGGAGGGLIVFDMGSVRYTGFMNRTDVSRWLGTKQRVDAVFLSHPHVDHYNFIVALGGNVKAYETVVFHACNASSYKYLASQTAGWNARFVRVTRCVANDLDCETDLPPCPVYEICGGEGRLRVLASELKNCSTPPNENSMVVKLEYRGTSLLLPGDLEDHHSNYDGYNVPRLDPNGPYDILLSCSDVRSNAMRIAHHGAYGKANKPSLYYHVNPQIAFSSSGFFEYHHPRCDIYKFYVNWIVESAASPDVLQPKLQDDDYQQHWYTCFNSGTYVRETYLVTEAIYVTSVCTSSSGAGTSELVNYIIEVNMKNVSGLLLPVCLTQFSAYNNTTFPGKFPC